MTTPARWSAIVPTLGWSPWLVPCLEALRREGGAGVEVVLVSQGEDLEAGARSLADAVLRPASNLGFAAAVNLGAAAARGEYLAVVNDDAIVVEGWAPRLLEALEADPEAAAVQGINLRLDDPETVDGAGLAWNRHWQAVQIGHGRPLAALPEGTFEVFGASATAAIYRRAALGEAGKGPFEERLFAYYEDVDLACRLRARGYRALTVGAAFARHAGSVSGPRLPRGHRRLIYGNRHLVLARLLGRALWPRWPRIAARDAADLWRAARRADAAAAAGIAAGWVRALALGPRFVRFGPPFVPLAELRRFRDDGKQEGSGRPGGRGRSATASSAGGGFGGTEFEQRPQATRPPAMPERLTLTGVVVHWRDEENLRRLVAAWPDDPAFELLVVDNGATLGELPPPARLLAPGRNLGFAGGINHGAAAARAPVILMLNADARPEAGALERLAAAFDAFPEAAGIVPALVGPGGEPQHRWQLQPLPAPSTLLLQTFFLAGRRGPRLPPPRGTAVEQPAAAALALRLPVLEEIGGLDEGFFPAWFEDVDLARRLERAGHRLLYEPRSRFVHAGGASVSELGYGPFLWIYYRGLTRYLLKHHDAAWALAACLALPLAMTLRLAALPLRRPRRAPSRRAAASGLLAVAAGAVSGWRRPAGYARRFTAVEDG